MGYNGDCISEITYIGAVVAAAVRRPTTETRQLFKIREVLSKPNKRGEKAANQIFETKMIASGNG
eukprot:scaffold79575_cov57-Attheya_sp.AAC.2